MPAWSLCETLEISFEENPSISDQELSKIPEDAELAISAGGGSTTAGKRWVTNGTLDRLVEKDCTIEDGWTYGRCKCIFNDPAKQKEFGSKADVTKRGAAIKKAWDSGKMDVRDHSKCGSKGDKNPSKRPEVRAKIRNAALKESKVRSDRMKRVKPWQYRYDK